ncbi:unnamed protein product [Amoebophrya sp. A120]|nr:unnamed protein product [Amoebophrya sp. A120]|eukprot:GSA120T00012904001.1
MKMTGDLPKKMKKKVKKTSSKAADHAVVARQADYQESDAATRKTKVSETEPAPSVEKVKKKKKVKKSTVSKKDATAQLAKKLKDKALNKVAPAPEQTTADEHDEDDEASSDAEMPDSTGAAQSDATNTEKTSFNEDFDPSKDLPYTERLSQEASKQAAPRTVFISGLPYVWDLDKIKNLLTKQACKGFGEIRAPTWQDTGRLRGYCHVEFDTEKNAKMAIKKLHWFTPPNSKRYLEAKTANEVKQSTVSNAADGKKKSLPESSKTLFVKNLPYTATEAEIAECFGGEPKVKTVRVGHEQGRSKGFCYIEFDSHDTAKKILQESAGKFALQNRTLFIDAETGTGPRAGYHYRKEAYENGFTEKVRPRKAMW